MDIDILKKLDFSDKCIKTYLTLLRLGPASVRDLAQASGLNRGSVYDALQWLEGKGLVGFYKQETRQTFVAEDPAKLKRLALEKRLELESTEKRLEPMTLELQAVYNSGGQRPVARYYEKKELNNILEDILNVCQLDLEATYRIYSAEGVREYLYRDFPSFSDARIAKGIKVKVIALGAGGELRGFDERKWLSGVRETGTYIIIYPGKTAYISLDARSQPVGVVIENQGVFETQKNIFDELWKKI